MHYPPYFIWPYFALFSLEFEAENTKDICLESISDEEYDKTGSIDSQQFWILGARETTCYSETKTSICYILEVEDILAETEVIIIKIKL